MACTKRWLAILCGITVCVASDGDVRATTPKPANVPPGQEIAVLDPNVDPLGRPTVVPKQSGIPGVLDVDIPQTVLVHRFYYTGDRSFQAQLMPGGPCIVVVNHPRTGERQYIPVQMMPGAPRVIYTAHAIEYDFGKHGVTIRFCLLTHRPKVEYRNCMTMTRHLEKAHAKINTACKEFAERSGLTQVTQTACTASKNACKDTADAIGAAGKIIVTPVIQAGGFIPGIKMFSTTPEDRAMRLQNAQLKVGENATSPNLTIPKLP